ncbi:unnamed protein product [Rangifer tarandus platyrhynchus]|uniref:Uncharacterized protein n=2 Tax=Rangifer tarandus platyrhynchus TaxID=3082113 RepID=A0ABN8ZG81_RANTA|nr:unnamed protein product [Rangifer tarandus platyrhynchus]
MSRNPPTLLSAPDGVTGNQLGHRFASVCKMDTNLPFHFICPSDRWLIDHAVCTQDECKHSSLSPTLNVTPDSQACVLCRQVVKAPHLCPQVPKPAHHYMSLVILNTPAGTSQ